MIKHMFLLIILFFLAEAQSFAGLGDFLKGVSRNSRSISFCASSKRADRYLPSSKTRHLKRQELRCSSNADNYVRRPQKYSVDEFYDWRDLERDGREGRFQMFHARRKATPLIKWQGNIPYQVVEYWVWEELVYGPHPSCGFEECNCVTTRTKSGSSRSCSQCMKSCNHDEDRHESWPCSREKIEYKAQYIRPTEKEWSPDLKEYYDILPSKYDLLPGEVEIVQVYSNSGNNSGVFPHVVVGDAWNEYTMDKRINGSKSPAACRPDVTHQVNVDIHTVKRILGKQTPNAFRLPTNGKMIDMAYRTADDGTKKLAVPFQLHLADTSALIMKTLADQSRNLQNSIEQDKQALGQDSNSSRSDVVEMAKESGFDKDTKVRVKLYLEKFGRDRLMSRNVYTSDVKSRVLSNAHLYSDDADEVFAEEFEVLLAGDDVDDNIYVPSSMLFKNLYNDFRYNLIPGRFYRLEISMYQKNVPFYAQDCDSTPGRFYCWVPLVNEENHYYSKPLEVRFKTPSDVDNRGSMQKFIDMWSVKGI